METLINHECIRTLDSPEEFMIKVVSREDSEDLGIGDPVVIEGILYEVMGVEIGRGLPNSEEIGLIISLPSDEILNKYGV